MGAPTRFQSRLRSLLLSMVTQIPSFTTPPTFTSSSSSPAVSEAFLDLTNNSPSTLPHSDPATKTEKFKPKSKLMETYAAR